ncbi:hypothetical protein GCM10027217_27550 [Pseudomaricurvus hydrocarbonicus]
MVIESPSVENRIITYHKDKCPNYSPKKVQLPVKESYYVQAGRGEHTVNVQMATVGEIGLLRLAIDVEAVGINVFHPDYVSFALPISWSGDYFINGDSANRSSIYMPGDLDSIHQRSKSRDVCGITIPRRPFVETIAALRGVSVEAIKLHDRELRLTETDGFKVRVQLTSILHEACSDHGNHSSDKISNKVFGLLTDTYLHALTETLPQTERMRDPNRIVRLAEEHFMAAGRQPVSLADLCSAADVGKTTLYLAFNRVCGLPPLAYLQKRRFMRAHSGLINSANERGRVKHTALNSGFTEIGRFSVEYRQLFGESPSETLGRDAT